MNAVITIDAARATLGLAQFRLALQQRESLMKVLAVQELESVYKTFDEQGPGWPPLSDASLSWNKKYTSAHMLLQNSGRGKASIGAISDNNTATLSTDLFYMRIQQEGFDGTQNVAGYSYTRHTATRDTFGRLVITNKLGRKQTVRRKLSSGISTVTVHGFSRHITIPPRPFLVFRPEDPQRIETTVRDFAVEAARTSGLEAN